jgi:hypothetical protein
LAGGSPQWAATSDLSRMVSPGPLRNTDNKLAPTNFAERVFDLKTRSLNEMD